MLAKGALAQIFSEGGPTMGARFIGDDQATSMNATMPPTMASPFKPTSSASGNLRVDKTSPFGATLLQGRRATPAPSGRPCSPGSAAAGTGASSTRTTEAGSTPACSEGRARSSRRRSARTFGSPTATSWRPGPTGFPRACQDRDTRQPGQGLQPDAGGGNLHQLLLETASADAATALGHVLTRVFASTSARALRGCWLRRAAASTDPRRWRIPNYGLNLFTPANVPALAGIAGATTSTDAAGSIITNTFSTQELALLAAFYQSGAGWPAGGSSSTSAATTTARIRRRHRRGTSRRRGPS